MPKVAARRHFRAAVALAPDPPAQRLVYGINNYLLLKAPLKTPQTDPKPLLGELELSCDGFEYRTGEWR
jgi:hypothetical protein